MGEEAVETGSRHGDAGVQRDLGSRLRTKRQRAQGKEVEVGGNGCLYRWTGGPITEEGGELGSKSGAAQSKGGGWVGSQDTEGDGDDPGNS